jgi:ComF family protein
MLETLLDLLYPPRCAACATRTAVRGADPFCDLCANGIDPVPSGCTRCGLPGPDPVCGACMLHPPAFDALRAGGLFGGPLADAIHALKYGNRPAVARSLGRWLASRHALPEGAAILSVPLGRRRRLARGYDQAALLAEHVARATRRPRLHRVLRRTRETPPQVGKTRNQRMRNVEGAFAATAAVAGKDLVLVDDVVTTGATADACARALKRSGARSVWVLAAARAE